MTELTRRSLLAGTAAVAAMPLTGIAPADAAAPLAGKQAPGFYRYKVGSMEVTVVTDGARNGPIADTLVRNASKDQVNAALQASGFQVKDQWPNVFNPTLVNTGSKLVMIDTGLGPATFEQSKGVLGQLHSNLTAAGVDRNAVDMVIISHYHGDHISGLLNADGTLAFPNAEVVVPAKEHDWWIDDANMNRLPEAGRGNFMLVRRVFAAVGNRLRKHEENVELTPGITAMATYGHTVGHNSHLLSSGSATALIQADITNYPAVFVRNPGWHFSFDADPVMAEATRRRVYDRAAADKTLVTGYHFPFPSHGYLEKDGEGYRLHPAVWNTNL